MTHDGIVVRYNPFFEEALFESHDDCESFAWFANWVENTAVREVVAIPQGQCLIINNRKALHGRVAFRGARVVNRLWFNELSH
jgi:alpha-ketoglutarate-dependent taurine dioxygenase